MAVLDIPTARVFQPLLEPARYKGAWGGRGSGKSHFFAGLTVEEHLATAPLNTVCVREVQKTLKDSMKRLIEAKISAHDLWRQGFREYSDCIGTPKDGVILFTGMQDHTADSIKSLEGMDRALIEEAHSLSERSLTLLRPTIRAAGSTIAAIWNPEKKTDAIDALLRGSPPKNSIVVRANWRDNPWFTPELEDERQHDLRTRPDQYDHSPRTRRPAICVRSRW